MLSSCLSIIKSEHERNKFVQLYDLYKKQMYRVAFSELIDKQYAEDVVHDVFFRVANNSTHILSADKTDSDHRNFLLKSTKNVAISYNRKHKNTVGFDEIIEESDFEISDDSFIDDLCSKADAKRVIDIINSMDKKYREVLYYHFVLELPIAEIAQLLNKKSGTIKKQLIRGKQKLLDAISSNENTD
ncbi:MAG: RNA polymerase sigma factor [Ruminococcus sp.]|nr:RNA polymerase sigma factor [Ruminococcus sp.]